MKYIKTMRVKSNKNKKSPKYFFMKLSLIGLPLKFNSVLQKLNNKYFQLSLIFIFIYTILIIFGMQKHPLWGDEADTAWFGKSVIKHGIPYGWDGVNIMGYRNGKLLDSNLINNTSPWLQYYIEAISLKIFGFSTISARIPFVIISIISIFLIYYLCYKLFSNHRISFLSVMLSSLSVAYILYSYQARYNPLTSFFSLLLIIGFLNLINNKSVKLFIISGVFLFYSHHLIFAAFFSAIILSAFIIYRNLLLIKKLFVSGIIIALFTLPWLIIFNPARNQKPDILVNFNIPNAIELVSRYLADFNENLGMPYIFLTVLIYLMFKKKSKLHPNIKLLLVIYILYLIFLSLFSIQDIKITTHSDIRYAMNSYPLLLIIIAYLFNYLINKNKFGYILLGLYLFTNVLSLTFPLKIYLLDYLNEITNTTYLTPTESLVNFLETRVNDNDTIFITPVDYNPEIISLYLNKNLIFINRISQDNQILNNNQWLPQYIYNSSEPPKWIILLGKNRLYDSQDLPININLKEYREYNISEYAYDLTRPELIIHAFYPVVNHSTDMDNIYIYKKSD